MKLNWQVLWIFVFVLLSFITAAGQTLGSETDYPVEGSPGRMAVGDFDGDGKLDVAVLDISGNGVEILYGNGDGTFQAPQTVWSFHSKPQFLAAGDFNKDGHADLAVAAGSQLLVLLSNGGARSFLPPVVIDLGESAGPIAVGDVNRHGNLDIVVARQGLPNSSGNGIALVSGNGDGSFAPPSFLLPGEMVTSLALADMNGDHALDLIFTKLAAAQGAGSGGCPGFTGALLLNAGVGGFASAETALSNIGGAVSGGIFAADINGDGLMDVIVLDQGVASPGCKGGTLPSSLQWAMQGAGHSFGNAQSITAPASESFQNLYVDDFNGSGKADVIVTGVGFNGVANAGFMQLFTNNRQGFTASNIYGTDKIPGPLVAGVFASGGNKNLATSLVDSRNIRIFSSPNCTPPACCAPPTCCPNGRTCCFSDPINCPTPTPRPPINTTTALTSSVNPSSFGQSVTFTATVSPSTATGTVTFFDGSSVICTNTLTSGAASCIDANLPPGTHNIIASYSGRSSPSPFIPALLSSSGSISQTVFRKPTSTTLACVPNPSVFGQSVTCTAKVTSIFGTPTGTVSFFDGPTLLGSPPLISGVATLITSFSRVGSHPLTASYNGDPNFNISTGSFTQLVNQSPTSTTLASSPNPSSFGQSVIFTAVVVASGGGSGIPTGTVTFTDNSVTPPALLGSAPVNSGKAIFSTSILSVGSHTITASYGGDQDFNTSNGSVAQGVGKSATGTTLTSVPNPSSLGQSVVFTAAIAASGGGSGILTGTVTFTDNSATPPALLGSAPVSNDKATFSTSILSVGSHNITASYSGDLNFNPSVSSPPVVQVVNKKLTTTTLASAPNPICFGQSVAFTAIVAASGGGSGIPTGTVTFTDSSATPPATLGSAPVDSTGKAVFATSALNAGSHTITASYNGDASFNTSSGSATQVVNKDASSTTLASSSNPSSFGQAVTFTAVVAVSGCGSGVPTGVVTFTDGSVTPPANLGTVSVDSTGKATFTISTLGVGSHNITVGYNGDKNFNPSTGSVTQVVNKSATGATVTGAPNPSSFGQSVALTAVVAATGGGSGIPTGTVTFSDSSATPPTLLGPATVDNTGKAIFIISTLSVGSHTITASYSGDANFNPSTGSFTQVVNKSATGATVIGAPNPSSFGQSISFTAAVAASGGGSGTPTGTVTFSDSSATPPLLLGTAQVNNAGKATFTTTSPLSVGSHTVTASYGGDGNFNLSTASVIQVVSRSTTSITLTSAPNPSCFGQIVAFTALVTASGGGSGIPTGMVTFSDGFAIIGTAPVDNTGKAAFFTSALNAGSHTITASYNGDANFNTSAGSTTQVVNKDASSVTLASSANPSSFGQAVTFTAVIAVSGCGSGTPGGTVIFSDGTAMLGSVPVDSTGKTTFTTSGLIVGSHNIVASYSGNANFNPSIGSLTQVVNKSASSVTLTSSANPSSLGQSVTFTALVAASGGGSGIPTGTVAFSDTSVSPPVLLGTVPVDNTGKAIFITSTLSVGSHNITASYGGDAHFNLSSTTITQMVVKGASSITSLTTSLNPSIFGQPVTFMATVTPSVSGNTVPTGTVTFSDGTTILKVVSLDSTGNAAFTIATLKAGSHSISANYSGDSNFNLSNSSAVTQIVNSSASSIALSVSAGSSTFGQPIGFTVLVTAIGGGSGVPTGTVTFTDGPVALGTASVDNTGKAAFSTGALSVGSHNIAASYKTDGNFKSSTSSPVAEVVGKSGSVTSLNSSADPVTLGQPVVFIATVTPGNGGTVPTGPVTFSDGSVALGSAPLDTTGKATFTTNALAAGPHSITANYGGDADYASSGSASLTEAVNTPPPGDYTLTINSTQATIVAGQTFTTQIKLTPENGLTGTVSVSCAGAPAASTCTVTPNSGAFDGSDPLAATLTLQTTGASIARNLPPPASGHGFPHLPLFFGLALMPAMAHKRLRNSWLLLALATLLALVGCGGGTLSNKPPAADTPQGSFTITVQSQSGNLIHSGQINLTVQ